MVRVLGPYPDTEELPSVSQDKWTTRALTEVLWKDGLPALSVLWMGDPDRSEHEFTPGSKTALAGIKSVDANLALVLQTLERKGLREKTDVLVVSDHGFSTIGRLIAVAGAVAEGGVFGCDQG